MLALSCYPSPSHVIYVVVLLSVWLFLLDRHMLLYRAMLSQV